MFFQNKEKISRTFPQQIKFWHPFKTTEHLDFQNLSYAYPIMLQFLLIVGLQKTIFERKNSYTFLKTIIFPFD